MILCQISLLPRVVTLPLCCVTNHAIAHIHPHQGMLTNAKLTLALTNLANGCFVLKLPSLIMQTTVLWSHMWTQRSKKPWQMGSRQTVPNSQKTSIPTFKDVILSKCDERQDEWAKVVQLRVNGVVDLPAADALYHVKCYNLFRKVPNDLRGNVTCKPVDDSLATVVSKMNADNLATWTVSELHTVYLANLGKLQKKQMCNLCDYFGDDLLVIQVEGCSAIVGFRNHVGKMLKLVNKTETPREYDDVDKLVRRVQAEVKDLPLPRNYDLGSFRHDRLVQDTSPALLRLISSLVSRDEGVTKQSLTLTQCIQQHVSKSWNQTTLGLAIKLHHKHGSSEMVQTLNEHGILAPMMKYWGSGNLQPSMHQKIRKCIWGQVAWKRAMAPFTVGVTTLTWMFLLPTAAVQPMLWPLSSWKILLKFNLKIRDALMRVCCHWTYLVWQNWRHQSYT